MSPAAIRADVFVWATCWGLLAADSAFDPATALASYLALNSSVRAILTTVTSVAAAPARLLLIANLLQRGATLGEVALLLNRAEEGGTASPWIVLGDPSVWAFPPSVRPKALRHDGSAVSLPPGLFHLPAPEGAAPAWAVRLTPADMGSGAGEGRVLLTRWPEADSYIGLHLHDRPRDYRISLVHIDRSPEVRQLQELYRPRHELRFALSFLRWTRQNPYARAIADPATLEHAVDERLTRQAAVSGERPDIIISGGPDRVARLLRAEQESWRRHIADLTDFFRDYVANVGGVLSHTYQRYGRVTVHPGAGQCPYCDTEIVIDRCRLTTIDLTRHSLRCPVCTNIGDLPDGWAGVVIETRGRLHPGRQEVRVCLRADHKPLLVAGFAVVAVQRVPFRTSREVVAADLRRLDDRTLAADVPVQIDPTAPTGVYYLTAIAVVDGAVLAGRRPVVIDASGRDEREEQ